MRAAELCEEHEARVDLCLRFLDAVASADTTPSIRSIASPRSNAGFCALCSPRGHLAALACFRSLSHASTFLPGLPSTWVCYPHLSRLAPLRYYAGSDSCRTLASPVGLSASFALPSGHPAPNHVVRPNVAFTVTSARSVSPFPGPELRHA